MAVKFTKSKPLDPIPDNIKLPPKPPMAVQGGAIPPGPPIKLVSIKKAAEVLHVSVSTVRRLKKKGVLAAYRVAGRVLFNYFELIAYVRQQQFYEMGDPSTPDFV